MKRISLRPGETVTLLPEEQLLKVLNDRKHFSVRFRQMAASVLSEKSGVIHPSKLKVADYFYFQEEGGVKDFYLPYEAIDFSPKPQSNIKAKTIESLKKTIAETYRGFGDDRILNKGRETYTGSQIAKEIEEETEIGVEMIDSVIQLTIDLLKRKKINV